MKSYHLYSTILDCIQWIWFRSKHYFHLSGCNSIWTLKNLVCKQTLNHLAKVASLAIWLSVLLWTKWFWVQVLLRSLKCQISRLFRARSSFTCKILQSVDSIQTHKKNCFPLLDWLILLDKDVNWGLWMYVAVDFSVLIRENLTPEAL